MLQRIFTRSIEGLILLAVSQLVVGMAVLVRLLPTFLRGLATLVRVILILSYRFYRLILEWAAPAAAAQGIDLQVGLWRVGATGLLSVVFGLLGWVVLGLNTTTLALIIFMVHGLIVGLAWDALERPDGLQLGVRLE